MSRGRHTSTRASARAVLWGGLAIAFVLAGFVSGYASASPDGLERVAEDHGFADAGRDHLFANFPLADYAVRGIDNERLAGGLAGVIGVTLTLAVAAALFWGMRWLRARSTGSARVRTDAS